LSSRRTTCTSGKPSRMACSVPSVEALSTTITRSIAGSVRRARQSRTIARELWVSTTTSTTGGGEANRVSRLPDTTIAILNYNGRALLERVLPTVAAQTLSCQVLVVDDGSTDDSLEYLAAEWPEANVVALPENVGITAAFNRCVAAAETEFVALVNNDIELEPGWAEALVAELRARPEAAAACGKLLQLADRKRIDAAGDAITWGGVSFNRGAGELDEGQYDEPGEVFAASAAAALYRRSALEAVGPFDEDFWAYLEDVDWAFRAWLAGFTIRYVPGAVAYHLGSATTSKSSRFLAYQRQNQLAVVAKNFPAGKLLRYAPRILLFQLLLLGAGVRDRTLGAHLRGVGRGLRLMPRMLRKRRTIQRGRKIAPDALERVVDRRWIVRARGH
jgi:GT2 family glycosyltransferase